MMADISGINNSGLQSIDSSSSSVGSSNLNLGQDDFLKLLTTQLSYQDPLEPQENGEFIGQMAQFGTVSGIQGLQDSFANLAQSLQSNQALQASTLVGRNVQVRANSISLEAGQAVEGSIELDAPIQNMVVNLFNQQGTKVNQLDLGNANPGFLDFKFNGTDDEGNTLESGQYTIEVEGTVGGQNVAMPVYLTANVDSVTLADQHSDLTLNLAGLGDVSFGDIRKISE